MASAPLSWAHPTHHLPFSSRPTPLFSWVQVLVGFIALSSLFDTSLAAPTTAPHFSNNLNAVLPPRNILIDAVIITPTHDTTTTTTNNNNHPQNTARTNRPTTHNITPRTDPDPSPDPNSQIDPNPNPLDDTIPQHKKIPPPFPANMYDTPEHAIASGAFLGMLGTCVLWAMRLFGGVCWRGVRDAWAVTGGFEGGGLPGRVGGVGLGR